MDQTEKALQLLHRHPRIFTANEKNLLKDLRTQLGLFYANFQVGATEPDLVIEESIEFLDSLVASAKPTSNSTSNNNNASDNREEEPKPTQGIVAIGLEGQKRYYIDGKPIHFKVFKNKPKNGDFQRRWNQNYETLRQFKEINGHLNITRSTPGYEDLGNWVAEQRRKLKRGKITRQQFETLTDLGFEWDRSYYFYNTFKEKKKKKRKTESSSSQEHEQELSPDS